jgi:hypothetical protein
MQPQTDAELIAWSFGQYWSTMLRDSGIDPHSDYAATLPTLTDQQGRALDVLGPDLFFEWAARGSDATLNHTNR